MGRAELDDLVEEQLAQVQLHPGRGAMGDHIPPVLEEAPQHHDHGHEDDGQNQ